MTEGTFMKALSVPATPPRDQWDGQDGHMDACEDSAPRTRAQFTGLTGESIGR